MTFWGYYRLVWWHAWDRAFEHARKFGFWVAPVGAIALVIAWILRPQTWPPLLIKSLPYAAITSLVFLFLTLVWMLLVRAPYELYVALLTKMPDRARADIRERLGDFLFDGLRLAEEAREYGMTDQVRDGITTWIVDVSVYLASDVSPSATAQFRNASKLELRSINFGDHERVLNGISGGCSYLSKFIDRYA